MKKIKIGIPRAMQYYQYGLLWKNFFEGLNCNVILSPKTNRKIISVGRNNSIEETCLSYKIYIGHVIELKDKCDYIIVSQQIITQSKAKICPIFNAIYDHLKYLIPKEKIIVIQTDSHNNYLQFIQLIKLGFKFSKNPIKVICSYIVASKKQYKYHQEKIAEQKNKMLKHNQKVLIISQFYNLHDNYISSYITDYLKQSDIIPIYSDYLDSKTAINFSEYFPAKIYLKNAKKMVGSLYYYENQISGVIYISTNNCEINSIISILVNSKIKQKPIVYLLVDETTNELSLETKLESFISIIKGESNE